MLREPWISIIGASFLVACVIGSWGFVQVLRMFWRAERDHWRKTKTVSPAGNLVKLKFEAGRCSVCGAGAPWRRRLGFPALYCTSCWASLPDHLKGEHAGKTPYASEIDRVSPAEFKVAREQIGVLMRARAVNEATIDEACKQIEELKSRPLPTEAKRARIRTTREILNELGAERLVIINEDFVGALRDPLYNPVLGDVIGIGDWEWEVVEEDPAKDYVYVKNKSPFTPEHHTKRMSMLDWRCACASGRDVKVIKRGDEE